MPKTNFLLVDLNEPKTKKLAETITSETSRKILNSLAEKENTEAKLAEELQIPISTVHYHLQKLQEAHLVKVEEFHYSPKGREVNHYKLANKYIIIAPGKVEGLKEKLKGILPVAGMVLFLSAVLKFMELLFRSYPAYQTSHIAAVQKAAVETTADAVRGGVPWPPQIALWFFLGSAVTMVLYLLISLWRERK